MPKKRKTRKEKMLKDQKRQVVHETPHPVISSEKKETQKEQQTTSQNITFSLSTANTTVQSAPKKTKPATTATVISTDEYGYLGVDLLKTAIVTSAVVITEIVIRILFRG
jgi:hypothetical protein